MKNKLKELTKEMKEYDKIILSFDKNDKLLNFTRLDPKENGIYLTIRVGLSGIYQTLNEWKDGNWMGRTLDNSITICRSEDKINLKTMELFN